MRNLSSGRPALSNARRGLAIAGIGIAVLGFVLCLPPLPQDQSCHQFADQRTLLGIANNLNVTSNLPLVMVGIVKNRPLSRALHAKKVALANDKPAGLYWY